MYGKLREWETDTYLIEGRVDILVNIEIHAPIVGTVYPNTYHHVYAAVRQAVKAINGAAGSDKMRESFANTDSITCFTFS